MNAPASPERDPTAAALARHVLSLLPPDRPHARAALTRLPLPLAHYLEGVLDRRLARDAALPASGWFDGAAETVQEAARAWRAAVRATARFPAEEWEATVGEAAREVLAYLVEPVRTLADRVYAEGTGPLPAEAVRARMAAFSPYPYLREIAEGYFDRKGVEAVSREDFERLLRRIDRRMVSLFGPHDWLALLEPLFDLVRPLPGGGRVAAPLLRRFFEAKGYDDLAGSFDAEAYDAAALRATLAAVLPDLDEAEGQTAASGAGPGRPVGAGEPAEPHAAERPGESKSIPEEPIPNIEARERSAGGEPVKDVEAAEAAAEPREEAEEPEPDAEEPLWMRLARSRSEAPAPPTPPAPMLTPIAAAPDPEPARAPAPEEPLPPTPSPRPPAQPPAGEPEPLWKRFAGEAATPAISPVAAPAPGAAREPLARLETRVLGPSATERRDWYVTQLTGGSEPTYRAVLEQLDEAPNWTEATQIIAREVFRRHRVNIYSDAAVAFTDAVEARFARPR